MKRVIVFSCFLFISFLCFAQQNLPVKIIGGIPAAGSKKNYQIQVGAFKIEKNAQDAISKLTDIDLEPVTEKFRDFTRVLVKEIPANQIRSYLENIAKAGFMEVIIREDKPSTVSAASAASAAPEIKPENNTETNIETVNNPSDLICKTWKIEKCPNPELVGSSFFVLEDGTYYVTNPKGESSSISNWRRDSDSGKGFEYTHNDWEYYGRAEIINLTEDSLELIDTGYSYKTPGRSSAGYSNLWVFSCSPAD